SILILEWLKQLKEKNQLTGDEEKEAENCLNLVIEGEVYKYIKSNSSYLADMEYAKMKKYILTSLNSKVNSSELNKEIARLFPNFSKWINKLKENGHETVSHIGQSSEAKIFVEVYKSLPDDIFSLIIHDCILITEENTLMVKNLLMNRVKKLYNEVIDEGTNLDKLFKISKVSTAKLD
ncbi:MAG: hypothetical protein ACO30S_00550, partial [Flavobacteriaceae bacterium]